MKKRVKRFAIISIAAITLTILILNYYSKREIRREEDLLKKISIGMDSNQVKLVLGTPDTVIYRENSTSYFLYFSKESPKSSDPYIEFDSNGRVYNVSNMDGKNK